MNEIASVERSELRKVSEWECSKVVCFNVWCSLSFVSGDLLRCLLEIDSYAKLSVFVLFYLLCLYVW